MINPVTCLDTLRRQVLLALKVNPATRNSDKLLTWCVWQQFYGIGATIDRETFMKLPSEDAVKRIRAVVQNDEKLYLPTDWEVAKKRGWNEIAWRYHLGYTLDLFGAPIKQEASNGKV